MQQSNRIPRRKQRTLTPAQQAATEARRQQLRDVAKMIAALSEEERLALAARLSVVTCEGRSLSTYNACMVASGCPDATIIGGFQQWRRQGRQVRQGEHSTMSIWAPKAAREHEDGTAPDERRFVLVAMFDIRQTEEL